MVDANKLKFPFLIGDSFPSTADTGQFFLNKLTGTYYYWDGSTWRSLGGGGGGATRFLDLTDTPNTYSGSKELGLMQLKPGLNSIPLLIPMKKSKPTHQTLPQVI